jgi:hypothetical protein
MDTHAITSTNIQKVKAMDFEFVHSDRDESHSQNSGTKRCLDENEEVHSKKRQKIDNSNSDDSNDSNHSQ